MIKFLKIWYVVCIVAMAAYSVDTFLDGKAEVAFAWAAATLWCASALSNFMDWDKMRILAKNSLNVAQLASDRAYENQQRLDVIDANRYKNLMK